MPMFKRQAMVLLALMALALGAVFYLWPEGESAPLSGRPVAVTEQEKPPGDIAGSPEKIKTDSGQLTPGGRLVVFVSGAVKQPGVFELPPGSRVEDAVKAAGGFGALADSQKLNLARLVADGEGIEVPRRQAAVEAVGIPGSVTAPGAGGETGGMVRLNSATQGELESLPGIGPSLAGRILEYRSRHGAFKRIEDVQQVPGIGAGRFKQMRDRLSL